jgi:hypothetical protein
MPSTTISLEVTSFRATRASRSLIGTNPTRNRRVQTDIFTNVEIQSWRLRDWSAGLEGRRRGARPARLPSFRLIPGELLRFGPDSSPSSTTCARFFRLPLECPVESQPSKASDEWSAGLEKSSGPVDAGPAEDPRRRQVDHQLEAVVRAGCVCASPGAFERLGLRPGRGGDMGHAAPGFTKTARLNCRPRAPT